MSSDKDIERLENGGKEPVERPYTANFRFPTTQFAYIELQAYGTQTELLEQYRAFESLLKGGEGIPDKEFDLFVERQLSGKTNLRETYYRMSPEQQRMVQINKRAIKRINARLERAENEIV
jgi:hypothetical protein